MTVLPASAVPVIVSVGSFEKPLSATVPVTGDTSSVTVPITGAAGADVSLGHMERGRRRTLIAGGVGRLGRQRVAALAQAPMS